MKINEVEALVGITKKNIRFYEEQGLLKPGRNSQNGYREYGEPEVELLRQIKLLRKLGVPLEEIRQMQTGSRTLGDGMRRHLVTLERERKNLDQAVQFCQALKDREVRLDSLDAGGLLREMEQMEQEGARSVVERTIGLLREERKNWQKRMQRVQKVREREGLLALKERVREETEQPPFVE